MTQFSGGDGFPDGAGQDITNWDVLYQSKLAGDCGLTDCDNGPPLPVGSADPTYPNPGPVSVSEEFHVPAKYDYWVVVVTYGCTPGQGEDCTKLRALDNVSVTLLEADEEGPYTKNVAGVPNASIYDTTFTIEANVNDTYTGNSNIASAQFLINYWGGGLLEDWTDMEAADGAFDSPLEDVSSSYVGGLPIGEYEICVRGFDAGGNEGNTSCSRFVTYDPLAGGDLTLQLSNECAQFYTLENAGAENEITTLQYGENIVFDMDFNVNTVLNISDSGNVNFKFHTHVKGDGLGVTSAIQYQFILNSMLKAKTTIDGYDPFVAEFDVKAKIVGQAQELDGYGILNGAQNNAELLFKVRIAYADGSLEPLPEIFDFSIACAGDPWSNLMENKDLDTRNPVGRGFGDEQNKYGWTGLDLGDALLVGTKNAFYDIDTYVNGDGGPISSCYGINPAGYPPIYWRLACMEIAGFGQKDVRDSNGAQLWNLSYKNKRWQLVYDGQSAEVEVDCDLGTGPTTCSEYVQGFRDSVEHNGKFYAAADLGAFISGVSYEYPFTFPGVALFVSGDGVNFEVVDACWNDGLCESQTVDWPFTIPDNNLSIRSLVSYNDLLYIATLNNGGGELWTYDDDTGDFTKVWEAGQAFPLLAELEVYDGKLYIGMSGVLETDDFPNNDYIFVCEGDCSTIGADPGDDPVPVAGLPDIDEGTISVIKLFAAKGKLFAGTVNFENGFSFLSYDGTDFDVIVDGPNEGGFFDDMNIYFWSMAEVDGRLVAGTFNPSTITEIPRGTAELWTSDDGINWFQYPMPIGWSLLGYGVRDLVTGDDGKTLFLLSATNMVAPNVGDFDNPLAAGTQVWSIRDVKITQPGKGKGKP